MLKSTDGAGAEEKFIEVYCFALRVKFPTSRPHIMSEEDPEILLAKREAAEMEANPTLLQQYAMAHDIS